MCARLLQALSATFLLFATLVPFFSFGLFMGLSAIIAFVIAASTLPILLAAYGGPPASTAAKGGGGDEHTSVDSGSVELT